MNGNQIRDLIDELKRFDERKRVMVLKDFGKYQAREGEILDVYDRAGDVIILVHTN